MHIFTGTSGEITVPYYYGWVQESPATTTAYYGNREYNFDTYTHWRPIVTIDMATWEISRNNVTVTFKETPEQAKNRLRQIIKSRVFPGVVISGEKRSVLRPSPDIREERARDTLRRVIGENGWRRFVKNGFIQVRAKSGRYYQIFPGNRMTRVFENGRHIETLCVVLPYTFPATDSAIMRYLMVLNDEKDFWNRAIKHGTREFHTTSPQLQPATQTLVDIYRNLMAG